MRYVVWFVWFGASCLALANAWPSTVESHSGGVLPTQATEGSPQTGLSESLESNVRAAWAAFKMRDREKYATFLTDNFQAVEADGDGERSKAQILREVQHSMYTDYLLQLFQVQPLGRNYAFVTYEATIQFPAGPAARYKRVFVGELWTERDGRWKMMRYQETPVR